MSAILPFLGGLRQQAPTILSLIENNHIKRIIKERREIKFCDPFIGGGSISYEASKYRYKILGGDLAERSIPFFNAIIKTDSIKHFSQGDLLVKNKNEESVLEKKKLTEKIDSRILIMCNRLILNARESGNDFCIYLAQRAIMSLIPQGSFGVINKDEEKEFAVNELNKRLKMLDDMRGVLTKLEISISKDIGYGDAKNEVIRCDARDLVRTASDREYDVVHLDPPTYGSGKYRDAYWWLDWFLEGEIRAEREWFKTFK